MKIKNLKLEFDVVRERFSKGDEIFGLKRGLKSE